MVDKKITELNNLTGADLVDADEFVVVDISADETKAITAGQLKAVLLPLAGGTMTGDLVTADDIRAFGAASDGATNDATALVSALATGNQAIVPANTVIEPTLAQVPAIVEGLDRILFQAETTIQLPAGEAAITTRVRLSNETLHYLTLKGPNTTRRTPSAVANTSDVAKNHVVTYTLDNAAGFTVGQYLYLGYAEGTGSFRSAEGCWKITALTGGRAIPVNSTLRWPVTQQGFAVETTVAAFENIVVASQYNSATTAGSDSYSCGIYVGSQPDFLNTGLTESIQSNSGSLWGKNLHVVEWLGTGMRNSSGNFYGNICSACANGWRGFQTNRVGSLVVKASSAIGNGQSGYQAEAGSFLLANNSAACGNGVQGVYQIGGGGVGFQDGVSENNVSHGLDARNGALILAQGALVNNNGGAGINNVGSVVHFGTDASAANNAGDDLVITEGGKVIATGAASRGVANVDHDSGAVLVDADGDLLYSSTLRLENEATGRRVDQTVSSAGDLITKNVDAGVSTNTWVQKASGTLYPSTTAMELGRTGDPVGRMYVNEFKMRSPDNTLSTVTVANGGTLTVS